MSLILKWTEIQNKKSKNLYERFESQKKSGHNGGDKQRKHSNVFFTYNNSLKKTFQKLFYPARFELVGRIRKREK